MKQNDFINKILIVIVTYNGQKFIKKCLEDIYNLSHSEILIIDNCSTDKTINIIEENYHKVKLIKNNKNIGFGQANNIGLSYALRNNFEFVLLLNQDTFIEVETINSLIEIQKANLKYGIISPFHYFSENLIHKSFENHIKENPKLIKDLKSNNYQHIVYDVPFVNAAIWLITKKCIESVGGFNPSFFHYGEDRNYCQRVLHKGLKIGVVPLLMGFHYSLINYENYYKKKEALYIKDLTLKFSNPYEKSYIIKECFILLIKITYNLFIINKRYKYHIDCLKRILRFEYKKILKHREESILSTTPFID